MKKLNQDELDELREIQRLINYDTLKIGLLKGNTALIPKGQELLSQREAELKLLTETQQNRINELLVKYGFKNGVKVSIDLKNGNLNKV